MPSVIVMDEDEPLRELLVEWLVAAGYRVREARLRDIVGGGLETVDLVVFDLPPLLGLRLHGVALVARLQAALPGAALLGLSTQVRESLPPGSILVRDLGLSRLLAKPCSRQELLAAAAVVLADRQAR